MSRLLLLIVTLFFFGLSPSLPATSYAHAGEDRPGNAPPPVVAEGPGLNAANAVHHPIQAQPASSSFAQRRQDLLDGIIALHQPTSYGGKFRYWYAQALLASGQTTEGLSAMDGALDCMDGSMFRVWAMVDAYLRWHSILSGTMKQEFEKQLLRYKGYGGGGSENHYLMLATARYLAHETWPSAQFTSDFRTSDPTGKQFLFDKMDEYVHAGTVEFDSPNYHHLYIGVMRSLADLAQDAEVRQKAALTAEWLILENVGEWLDGHWLSGSLRNRRSYAGQDDFEPTDYVLWLYFGASVSPDFADKKALFAVQAAATAYRLPESIAAIAADREQAFVHRETDTWGDRHYYETTYLNRDYGVYSVMEDYMLHTTYCKQYHRWAVQWVSDRDKSTLYVKHPNRKTGEEGTTGYEQVLQHEGTLLAVYAIPTDYLMPYVRLRTPLGFEAVIDESHAGDVFFHYGTVLIALRMSEPFAWDAASDVHDHPAQFLGVVVETAPPSSYPGNESQQLQAFKNSVQQHALVFSTQDNQPKLTYTTIDNDVLLIKYDGKRKVNGLRLHPEETWPLLDNPWIYQEIEDDQLVVETCQERIAYDFGSWTKHVTPQSCENAGHMAEQGLLAELLSETNPSAVPGSFSLGANYPNPFNPTTTISYILKEDALVSLKIYNVLGQEVATLVDEPQAQGAYIVRWDARDRAGRAVASGTYLYRIEAGDFVQTKRMLLIK